ncbi:MAG: hypothetical protein WBJ81_00170 [Rickettsiales bacterium]
MSSIFTSSANFFDRTAQKKIFELSEKITSQIQQGRSFILHTGTPIEAERAYSEHAKDSNHLKIIVINGGLAHGMQDINSDYVEQDTGFGGMWKCRETINIELDTSFLEFLKHYIYKVLFLPYLPSNDADGWRTMEVMKDVYFKYENFLGYCKELTYKPVINDNSPSFPSQVFGNCVTYNLFHAIKFLFELNNAQFTTLKHQLRCSYNYLMHQNDKWIGLKYKSAHNGNAIISSKSISIEHTYVSGSMDAIENVEYISDLAHDTSSTDTFFNIYKDLITSDHKAFYDIFLRILINESYEQVEDALQAFLRIEEETILGDLIAVNDFENSLDLSVNEEAISVFKETLKQNRETRLSFLKNLQVSHIETANTLDTAVIPSHSVSSYAAKIYYVTGIKYKNVLLNNNYILQEVFKLYEKDVMNLLIELGEDEEQAEKILLATKDLEIEKVLKIFFNNKVKTSQQEEVTDSILAVQLKTQEDQTLEAITKIEAIIGKETLAEIAGWHQYISKSLSNNPLSSSATQIIQIIGSLVKNLEEVLDFGNLYESNDIENQVTIIITQLEHWIDFFASGTIYVGLPPRYPDFDPDYDFGGGGGSSGGSDDSHISDQNNISAFLPFAGNTTIIQDFSS